MAILLSACGGSDDSKEPPQPVVVGSTPSAVAPVEPEPPAVVRVAYLTGETISQEMFDEIDQRRPLAVMIDNIQAATPQIGVDQADVVIEALVEGGITRLMAVYHSKDPAAVEPVRSSRTPFLYWAKEYDALYVHVGSASKPGPANASQQVYELGIYDLDLQTQAMTPYYRRDPKRAAPHDVLVNATSLRERARQLGYEGPAFIAPWAYASGEGLAAGQFVPGFSVRFGVLSPRFVARWQWDEGSQRYLRFQFGAPHVDALSGVQLAFSNVVIQYTDAWIVDAEGHVLMDVVGEGRAQVFRGGHLIEGTWRKAGAAERTEFLTLEGQPIAFLPGPTWIEVIEPSGGVAIE